MDLLILTPSFKVTGGVASHYMGLANFFQSNITFCKYGKRPHILSLACLIPDFLYFIYLLLTKHWDAVIINPSFRRYQLIRDGLYLLVAKLFRIKVITFFHGWDLKLSKKMKLRPKLFNYVYGKSLFMFVLCSDFKKELRDIGIKVPIILTTTKVDDFLISDFDINKKTNRAIENILFLARAEKSKGLHIVLQAYAKVVKQYPELKLLVCGQGKYLDKAKRIAKSNCLKNVQFLGNVSGNKKIECFTKAGLYILPTEQEGMATSILEAMAFGLPIITRPVGGVKDFFDSANMGVIIDSFEVDEFANAIIYFIKNQSKTRSIAKYNYNYAIKHFLASKVAYSMEFEIQNRL